MEAWLKFRKGNHCYVRAPRPRCGMHPYLLVLLFLCCALVLFAPASSLAVDLEPGEDVRMDADRLNYDQNRRLYVAEGNVVFESGAMKLTCDTAEYSDLTGAFTAEGNVVFTDEKGTVLCSRVEGNARTGLGTFYAAEMDNVKGGYFLKGDQIDKTGEESYRITRGSFSECGKQRPAWEVRGKTLWVTKEEYVTGRHTTMRVAGVPVLYTPYFFFPIKTTRQSGLLPPVFGQGSRNGKSIELDYFWNMDTNRDATFSYEYLGDNGNRFGMEYRYALTQDVRGALFGKYIHDRNADREGSRIGMNQDRWEIGLTHYQNLQDRVYGGIFSDFFSDGFYLSDFSTSSEARVQTSGQSDLTLVDRWEGGNLSTDFRYYQEMGVRREKTTLQSLPEVRLDLAPRRAGQSNWFYAMDSGFVNFYRQEGYRSTLSPDISSDPWVLSPVTPYQIENIRKLTDAGFDAETALRFQGVKGRRLDLFPNVSLPLDLTPSLVVTPLFGYRETLYNRGAFSEDFADRGIFYGGADLSSRIFRDFSLGSGGSIRHIVEPGIVYDYRPEQGQKEIPIYDEIDTVGRADQFHLKLTNRFLLTRKGEPRDGRVQETEAETREMMALKFDALYDRLLSEQRFRSITGEWDLNFTDSLYMEINSLYDFLAHDFERLNLDLKYKVEENLTFQIGRRFTQQIPVDPNRPTGAGELRTIGGGNTLNGLDNNGISYWTSSLNWEPNKALSMSLSGYFNAKEATGDDLSFKLSYQTECWGAMLTMDRYDESVLNDHTNLVQVDKVNEIRFFFTIKSLHFKLFSNI
ncbi:MAG: LPS assembly protein LptD [bacterium]